MSFDPGMTLHINKKSVELKRMWHKLKEFFKAWERYLERNSTVPNKSWKMGGEEPSANVSSKVK